jgi:hypothetical protein
MSGRSIVTLADGRVVRGYRKTSRRNRPTVARTRRVSPPPIDLGPPSPDYPVQLFFLLPDSILVSPGPHGFNCRVLPGNAVSIRGRSADHGFALARAFFAAVAKRRMCQVNCSR